MKESSSVPHFWHRESNKRRKKTLIGSVRWRRSVEFLEIEQRGELKKLQLANGVGRKQGQPC
jgi:hypothetical protein